MNKKLMQPILYMRWTKQELKFLKKNYATTGADALSRRFRRSRETVVRKACDLGLKKTKSFISELRRTIGAKPSFKNKISRAQKGKKGYWLGKRRSAGTKQKISKTMRARFKSYRPAKRAMRKAVRKAVRRVARKPVKRAKSGFWSFLSGR